MATKLHKDVEYLWCMGHWMHVKDLVRVQIFSEIKVQNIQGTHGSEGPWTVFLKTHPNKIYKNGLV